LENLTEKFHQPYLVNVAFMESADGESTARLINDTLISLDTNFDAERAKVLLSDAAPYMIKCGKNLRIFFPLLLHATCVQYLFRYLVTVSLSGHSCASFVYFIQLSLCCVKAKTNTLCLVFHWPFLRLKDQSTCLAHGLHLVCEKATDTFPNVNRLIAAMKMGFVKSPNCRAAYRDGGPNLPLPPEPILTR
jgi:hypothetical protein